MVVASDKADYGSFADTTSPGTSLSTTSTNNNSAAAVAATIAHDTPNTPTPTTSSTTAAAGRRRGSGSGNEGIIIVDEGVRIGSSANSPVSYSYQQAVVYPHPRPFYHKYRSASVGDSESLLAQRIFPSSSAKNNSEHHKGSSAFAAADNDNKKKRADFFKGFTLSGERETGGRTHIIPNTTVIQFESHKKGQGEGGENIITTSREIVSSSSGSSPMSTSSTDFHQRQPLLSESKNGSAWCDDDTHIDIDDDDIPKESKRNGSVIRIDPPPASRGESDQSVLKRFPKEKRKTVLAFLWAAFNLAFATVSLALTHERRQEHAKPLPDIILDSVVAQDWALNVSEILIMVSTGATAMVILFHKHRWIVCRRVFFLVGILYLMRSLTMYVTVLPVASYTYQCAPKANDTSFLVILTRALRLMSGFGLSINGQQVYCGDYIYSGHTVILVSCFLIIQEYSSKRLYLVHWASWIASLTGIVMVLISRGHYTVDILLAYYVTTRLFWMYHTMANNPSLKNYSSNNFLARIWWFRVFQYLEGNVGGPLPRVYGCGILNWFSKHIKSRRSNRI